MVSQEELTARPGNNFYVSTYAVHATKFFYNRQTNYYLIGKDGRIFNATRANFFGILNGSRSPLIKYIESERIDFDREWHLRKLFLATMQMNRGFFQQLPTTAPQSKLRMLNDNFELGYVVFLDGTKSKPAKCNYDLFLKKIFFIKDNDDTTAWENDKMTKELIIGNQVYRNYRKKGLFKIIDRDSKFFLVSQEEIVSHFPRLDESEKFERRVNYYLLQENGGLVKATRDGFLNAFPNMRFSLPRYMDSENINFFDLSDVKKIFRYVVQYSRMDD